MLSTFEYGVNTLVYGQMDQTVTVENGVVFLEEDSFNYYSMDQTAQTNLIHSISYSFLFLFIVLSYLYISIFLFCVYSLFLSVNNRVFGDFVHCFVIPYRLNTDQSKHSDTNSSE